MLTSIYASATEYTFCVFHLILAYHIFNRKAHWAVVNTGMAVFTVFWLDTEL